MSHHEHHRDEESWDQRYRESARIWSGKPNVALVAEVTGLPPGRALDLGCGEGADAIWLALQGWRVTAVDISGVALARAASHAAATGVAGQIDWQQHELGITFPDGSYDLVSAQFLHSWTDLPREQILRTAAAAVTAGGTLLIVGHSDAGPFSQHAEVHLPGPQEVLTTLDLPDGEWDVLVCAEHERVQVGPDGQPFTRTDNTVKVRRREELNRRYSQRRALNTK